MSDWRLHLGRFCEIVREVSVRWEETPTSELEEIFFLSSICANAGHTVQNITAFLPLLAL